MMHANDKNDIVTLTDEIIKEEEKVEKENTKDIEDNLSKVTNNLADGEFEEEQRFMRLENLLTKSKFYCDFLLTKLDGRKLKYKSPLKDNNDINNLSDKNEKIRSHKKIHNFQSSFEEKDYKSRDICIKDAQSTNHSKYFTGGTLKPYQIEGLEWLKILYENGVNGILADEMGLGKTVQCIAFIAHLIEKKVRGPYMIVAPLSTIPNWLSEFKRFAPKITTILYQGNYETRKPLRAQFHTIDPVTQSLPVIITSYDLAMRDAPNLKRVNWRYLVIDEGHRIKNFKCKLFSVLKSFTSANRLLLTGTPLQNNLAELWALLNFLVPEIFDDLTVFVSWFDVSALCTTLSNQEVTRDSLIKEREQKVVNMLHQILAPFLLRRLKSNVELDIPPKKELIVYTPLSPLLQSDCYKAILNGNLSQVIHRMRDTKRGKDNVGKDSHNDFDPSEADLQEDKGGASDDEKLGIKGKKRRKAAQKSDFKAIALIENGAGMDRYEELVQNFQATHDARHTASPDLKNSTEIRVPQVTNDNLVMMMRKCCSHPYLLDMGYDYGVDQDLINSSGKFLILDQLLPRLIRDGHKVLLFSQMTSVLDVVEDYCTLRSIKYLRLDGSTALEQRSADVSEFQAQKSAYSLYLISTRAGGLGINLSAANAVIIFDSDWNPQSDLQAQDRCHRIGQKNPVVVYRFVTEGTVDQYMVNRAYTKKKLEKMIIPKEKFKDSRRNLSYFSEDAHVTTMQEMLEMLTSKEYDSVYNHNPGGGEKNGDSQLTLEDIKLDREELDALVDWKSLFKDYYHENQAKSGGRNLKRLRKSKVSDVISTCNKFKVVENRTH